MSTTNCIPPKRANHPRQFPDSGYRGRQTQIHVPPSCSLSRDLQPLGKFLLLHSNHKSPSAQHPCSRTRYAVMAKRIQRTCHNNTSAKREGVGDENAERGARGTKQDQCESRNSHEPQRGPLLGIHQSLIRRHQPDQCSTRDAATCCQPCFTSPGSWSSGS